MKNSVITIIPCYQTCLSEDEQISIRRCIQLIGKENIRFVSPERIEHIEGFEDIEIEHFADEYFLSIQDYNRLMLSKELYARFEQYTYLLIHQPDVFMFRNEIEKWVKADYSIVGAPWLLKEQYRHPLGRIILHLRSIPYMLRHQPFNPLVLGDKVGNGGFSLRKIADCLRVIEEEKEQIAYFIQQAHYYTEYNEDAFWATRTSLRYPTAAEAAMFAIDDHPERCIKQNKRLLPMAAHGWCKEKNRAFWWPIISAQLGIRKLRVYFDYQAFVHQQFGGVSRIFYELISHLPAYGIEPIVGVQEANNIYIGMQSQKSRHKLRLINRRYCKKEIDKGEFDILHATYFDPYITDVLHDKPLVITIHDLIDEIFREGHTQVQRRRKLSKIADRIIAVSNNTATDIERILGVKKERIAVVYHGCSLQKGKTTITPALPKKYVLYVGGRRRNYKAWPMFMEAMTPLVKKGEIELVCVGESFNKKEEAYITALGIRGKVHSILAEEDQLYTIYHSAACFVFPSYYEGFGLPILEAWKAECPIVLSRSSCFEELAGKAALYFDAKDAEDLRKQVEKLLQDEELRYQLVSDGKTQLQTYTWELAAEKLSAIYHQIYKYHV